MSHPYETTYHGLRATSKTLGVPIQIALNGIEGKPFGLQDAFSQDGLYIAIDIRSEKHIEDYPELEDFIEDRGDLPFYITNNDGGDFADMSFVRVTAVVGTKGEASFAWAPVWSAP